MPAGSFPSRVWCLPEQAGQHFFQLADGMYFNAIASYIGALHVELGDIDLLETQLLGFADPLVDAVDGTDLPA